VLGILALLSTLALLPAQSARAVTTEALSCTPQYQIVQTFSNLAKWEMCWEPRAGYGYRLSQVIFTPPNGIRRKVLDSTHVAQLFVPYDDNGARFHDIGYGVNLFVLTAAECPGGSLLTNSTVCLVHRPAGYVFKNVSAGASAQSDSFAVFGYFAIGQYNYIFQYTFFDDGSIEPAIGASGSLQRFAGTSSTGWPIGQPIQFGVNHNHFVIWRMDFDLDGSANNRVERINFAGAGSDQRNMTVTPLITETRETNNLTNATFWRVRNTVENNADGRSVSYEIEPSVTDQLRAPEDFTQQDFYLTQFRSTEELVDNGLVGYVNGEAVTDVVLWYGVNFHHVPRGEDDVKMPAHWQGFRIRPRDVTTAVAPVRNTPPVVTNPGAQTTPVSTSVSLQISATDANRDTLTYSASGLPPGLGINSATGLISGTPTTAGSYAATVTVSDGRGGTTSTSFGWTVTAAGGPGTQTFSTPAAITIRDNTTASPYPASVTVAGMSGTISKVVVTLNGLTHTCGKDIDILLVGPGGKGLLMSDAGACLAISSGTNVTFDTAAAASVPQSTAITTGTYKPTDYAIGPADSFPAPGPAAPYTATLAGFNGTPPNGDWKLFVVDDEAADTGQIASGFSLTITTGASGDTTPPTVNTKTPTAGATGIALGTTVTAAFSEAMTAATISGSTFTLQGPGGAAVPATVGYNTGSFTATLTPSSALAPSTTYTAIVKGGASGVKDLAGNPLLADVTWSFTTAASGPGTQTFSTPAAITIRDNTTASPYPAGVTVAGMSGTISKVVVTLNGLTHTYPADLDVLLVSPAGQKVMLMSDAGGGTDVSGITLTFDAAAAVAVPQTTVITTGTYRPTNYDTTTDTFPAPAPASPFSTLLTAFNGTSPNGTWNLFVRDDSAVDTGALSGGYTLTITTQ
jgi:subtilisin-like proprotein convertase family protein